MRYSREDVKNFVEAAGVHMDSLMACEWLAPDDPGGPGLIWAIAITQARGNNRAYVSLVEQRHSSTFGRLSEDEPTVTKRFEVGQEDAAKIATALASLAFKAEYNLDKIQWMLDVA